MKDFKSEHTANLAMAHAPAIRKDMTIGLHFAKPAPKRAKPAKAFSFRALFKAGAIK